MEKDNVDLRVRELSDSVPGDPKYLSQYVKALTEILDELSVDKQGEYETLAITWNMEGPSELAKRRSVLSRFVQTRSI